MVITCWSTKRFVSTCGFAFNASEFPIQHPRKPSLSGFCALRYRGRQRLLSEVFLNRLPAQVRRVFCPGCQAPPTGGTAGRRRSSDGVCVVVRRQSSDGDSLMLMSLATDDVSHCCVRGLARPGSTAGVIHYKLDRLAAADPAAVSADFPGLVPVVGAPPLSSGRCGTTSPTWKHPGYLRANAFGSFVQEEKETPAETEPLELSVEDRWGVSRHDVPGTETRGLRG
jgi:hypothetical protein